MTRVMVHDMKGGSSWRWWCPTMVASHMVERSKPTEKVSGEVIAEFESNFRYVCSWFCSSRSPVVHMDSVSFCLYFSGLQTPNEECEGYLSHLFGDKCTGNRNEMAQLPEGITELLKHEKLPVPLIKCHNVIVLTTTNVDDLDRQWDALIDLRSTNLLAPTGLFVSKHLETSLLDPLSKIAIEFPDIYTGTNYIYDFIKGVIGKPDLGLST
ncbi:hypothetical protein Hanom_Chr16g01491211 [Helianthus anomalus]